MDDTQSCWIGVRWFRTVQLKSSQNYTRARRSHRIGGVVSICSRMYLLYISHTAGFTRMQL